MGDIDRGLIVLRILRLCLALQLLAMALPMLFHDGSPIAKLWWQHGSDEVPVGDLAWIDQLDERRTVVEVASAPTSADRIFLLDKVAGGLLCGLALASFRLPLASVLWISSAWVLAWSVSTVLLRANAFAFLAPAAQGVRWLLPLAALYVWHGLGWRERRGRHDGETFSNLSEPRRTRFAGLLRVGIALTFAAHGYEALEQNPKFVDLILLTADRMLGWELSQAFAQVALAVIGWMDIAMSLAVLLLRSPGLALWMTIWGALTAFSRITALGFAAGWGETMLRVGNFAVPLMLFLLWQAKSPPPKTD